MSISRQFAIVTGASTGIGLELAKCCAREGFDVLIAADEPQIESTAMEIRALGAIVETVQADLSTTEGLDKLYGASKRMIGGRQCNAGGH
jgi:NAD(P)-dependent dehydrogenase (short-subunit alcohol dehydrogenase family)